jgi:hypothetical protein
MPHKRASHEADVARNSDASLQAASRALVQDPDDRKRITIRIGLSGFGKEAGQARMESAILRSLWPEVHGIVDWRNWAILMEHFGHRSSISAPVCCQQGFEWH